VYYSIYDVIGNRRLTNLWDRETSRDQSRGGARDIFVWGILRVLAFMFSLMRKEGDTNGEN
jgi:hypothetical protein